MFKSVLICLSVTACLANPGRQRYSDPPQDFTELDSGVSRRFGSNPEIGRGLRHFSNDFSRVVDGFGSDSAAILRDDREESEDGSYAFTYETEDGVIREESGVPGPDGAIFQQGSWSFTFPDGTPGKVRYIADENGFRIVSNLIPSTPEHAFAQAEKAEQERAAGILHDGQYRAEDHFGDDLHDSTFSGTNTRALSFSRSDPAGPFFGAFRNSFPHSRVGTSFGRNRNTFLRSGIHGNHFDRTIGTEYDGYFDSRNQLRNRFSGIRNNFDRNFGVGPYHRGPYDDPTFDLGSQRMNDYDGQHILT